MSDWFRRFTDRQHLGFVGLLSAAAVVTAWVFRYVQDDAFITFRYASMAAQGHGLVLNPGERVEGYTNFLWTALMVLPEKAGWDTPTFSLLVTLVLMVGAIFTAYRFSSIVLGDRSRGLLATAVLVANMSFVGYGSGGLETMFQTLLVTVVGLLLVETPQRGSATARRLAAGIVAGVALLVRLDSTVLVAVWFLLSAWHAWRTAPSDRRAGRTAVAALQLGLPVLVIVVPWLVWKYDYYGSLVPNTQAAKSAGIVVPFLVGLFYVLWFPVRYLGVLLVGRLRRQRSELVGDPTLRQVLIVAGVWCLYICVVGGDFMEYRFMVPIIPQLAMVAAVLLDRYVNPARQVVLCSVLVIVSGVGLVAPTFFPYPAVTFDQLRHWPTDSGTSWKGIGEYLAEKFPGGITEEGQPVVAVEPLGAISYYSQLPTVDMLGLADPEIAREGLQIRPYYPGHVRVATMEQLLERGVNLIIGLPQYWDLDDTREVRLSQLNAIYTTEDLKKLPEDATMVFYEAVEGRAVGMIYVQRNDKVDALVESGEWWEVPISRVCNDADMDWLAKLTSKETCEGL